MTQPCSPYLIEEMLPHRPPFLFVDEICSVDLEKQAIVTMKYLDSKDPVFAGHFPNAPLMPGVLITEAMAQSAGILMRALGCTEPLWLMSIQDAKFRKKVFPNTQLQLQVQLCHSSVHAHKLQGYAYVNAQLVSEALITLGEEK